MCRSLFSFYFSLREWLKERTRERERERVEHVFIENALPAKANAPIAVVLSRVVTNVSLIPFFADFICRSQRKNVIGQKTDEKCSQEVFGCHRSCLDFVTLVAPATAIHQADKGFACK